MKKLIEKPITSDNLKDMYRLKEIIRYNTRAHLKNESVAEHSFYVGVFGLMLCDILEVSDEVRLAVLTKTLLHDLPEIDTNDITHDTKERLNLRPFLKKYEDMYYDEHFPLHAEVMADGEDTLVNNIVDLADVYSVLQYSDNELRLGNNDSDMNEINLNAKVRLSVLIKKINDKIEEEK